MKIVWCDQNQQLRVPFAHTQFYMQEEIAKIADVTFYGLGGGRFIPELDVLKIIEKEEPDVIVFYTNQLSFKNTEKISPNIPKFCKCSDPHAPNFERHVNFLNKNKINMASIVCWEGIAERYKKSCPNTYFIWMPIAINNNTFYDKGKERIYDCSFSGSSGRDYYPLRAKIIDRLRINQRIKFYYRHAATKPVSPEEWTQHLNQYIDELNLTKITPFGNSIYNYAVARWYEGMACGSLILAPKPLDAEQLHFIPYENYVPIDENKFEDQILYYLEHENERKKITDKAKETILKYHTAEIRAKQLLNYLADMVDF